MRPGESNAVYITSTEWACAENGLQLNGRRGGGAHGGGSTGLGMLVVNFAITSRV
jgi:hypothetical protein